MQRVWGRAKYGIQFDSEVREWVGIDESDRAVWKRAYPDLDLAWLTANPSRGCRKKNMQRFVTGWLKRSDEDGRDYGRAAQAGRKHQSEAGGHRRAREARQYR